MKQYEYEVRNKRTGATNQVRVTAPNQMFAWAVAFDEYGDQFEVADFPKAVRPAHQVLGEIDATNTDYPQRVLDLAAQAFGMAPKITANVCDCCDAEVAEIIGAPDGQEVCQACFDGGAA